MVKEHNIRLVIENYSEVDMHFKSDWFDSGRLADSYNWPTKVAHGGKLDVLCYERDWAWTGCSGSVDYQMNDTLVTFAFSNPLVGTNKLGVGDTGRKVWDNMTNHDYSPFTIDIIIDRGNGSIPLTFECRCTEGTTNSATVKITRA